VLIGANVGSIDEAKAAAANGADRAGLVRTEFLFLERSQPPSVDEQEAVYRDLAQAMGGRRIVVRTLDVGGDKPLRYLPQPIEANPFLGVRGIRFTLRYPQLLADQLLAIVRVAHDFPVSVLFPMVSALDELTSARRLLDAAVTAASRGIPAGLEIGIMVEVPAAALNASVFVPHVDFFSIGTNDLTQYAMASERGSSALAALADPLDPAVLRLIDLVGRAAGDRLPVALCGELAADERATGLLVGLGVRELSVVPTAVPAIKQAVRYLTSAEAGTLAATALTKGSAAEVRALLGAGS
jgi:phosphoenolpyruvate-protein kinase (PTS system EI component)